VQAVEIKGIASGLQVQGYGGISYTYYNDKGLCQQMVLKNCLYVPRCTARLLCPRQLGLASGNPLDGFSSQSDASILTFQGQPTTIQYDTISNLPVLYTAPGIQSYVRYCKRQSFLTATDAASTSKSYDFQQTNLSPNQQWKLHLHERCAHVHWDQLNR
jgi:hypothetical protein